MAYAIIKIEDNTIFQRFNVIPKRFQIGTRRIVSPPKVGDEGLGYRFVDLVEIDFSRPGPHYTQGTDTAELSGDGLTLTVTRSWTAWTQAEIDAYESGLKDATADQFDDVSGVFRAMALVMLDESNRHCAQITAILQAASDATSLATFKSAMGSIQPIPQRTSAQLKAAVRAKLGNGS